jgi:hypothetical protein
MKKLPSGEAMASRMEELLSEIMQTEFHKVSGKEWDAVFEKLLELLGASDPKIVDAALERVATAIWAEKYIPNHDPTAGREMSRIRLIAVLARLEQRADVVDRVLGFASHAGSMADDDEFRTGFLEWVDSFQPPPDAAGEWDNTTLTIRMKLGAFGDDRETASPHLTDLLDHSSLQVRACAAATLGELITGEIVEHAGLGELMRVIHDREIERPGIAGPFYGVICYHLDELPAGGRASVKAWMLSILENRKAPEPPLLGLHFNGIDFHAHELFAGDPDGVRELIGVGRTDIAVAAATGTNEFIEGMEDVLIELGNSNDAEICRRASWHLAYHYRILHSRGQERGFVSAIPLSGGEELFLNGHPESPRHPYAAILYPPAGWCFTHYEARRWIDRLLPADIRGETTSFFPNGWPGETLDGGQISRNKVHFSWACGAVGSLKGDVPARRWDSLTIIWHGEKETWAPGDDVTLV